MTEGEHPGKLGLLCGDVANAVFYHISDRQHHSKLGLALVALAEYLRASATTPVSKPTALLLRAYEVVHHDDDCPGLGRGDEHCRCDAVPFLRDLARALGQERV